MGRLCRWNVVGVNLMSDQEIWLSALKGEGQKRKKLRSLEGKNKKERERAAQEWWGGVRSVLSIYRRMLKNGSSPNPPPLDLLAILEGQAGYLEVGQIPGPISDAGKEGRRRPGPTETKDIAVAVAYLAATKGEFEHNGTKIVIEDRHPTKTVSEAYGVKKRTVQGWRNRNEPAWFAFDDLDAKTLTSLMEKAGEGYSIEGRGHKAISSRDTKRGERNPRG